MNIAPDKTPAIIMLASTYALAALILGYVLLGLIPMLLFAFGFVGGLALWLMVPTQPMFDAVRVPFYGTLTLFVVHKLEEQYMDFFPALAKLTDVSVPESGTFLGLLLYALAGVWLLVPFLMARGYQFGYFLAWSFFTAMGVTEMAHFIFPFFVAGPYGYFPGMASAAVLVPFGWWGLWGLAKRRAATSAEPAHQSIA